MSSVPEIFDSLSYGPAPEDARAADWLGACGWLPSYQSAGSGGPRRTRNPPISCVKPANSESFERERRAVLRDVDAAVDCARGSLSVLVAVGKRARSGAVCTGTTGPKAQPFLRRPRIAGDRASRFARRAISTFRSRARHHLPRWIGAARRAELADRAAGSGSDRSFVETSAADAGMGIALALPRATAWCSSRARIRSLTALSFAEPVRRRWVPPGVINILTGDAG